MRLKSTRRSSFLDAAAAHRQLSHWSPAWHGKREDWELHQIWYDETLSHGTLCTHKEHERWDNSTPCVDVDRVEKVWCDRSNGKIWEWSSKWVKRVSRRKRIAPGGQPLLRCWRQVLSLLRREALNPLSPGSSPSLYYQFFSRSTALHCPARAGRVLPYVYRHIIARPHSTEFFWIFRNSHLGFFFLYFFCLIRKC